MADISKILDEMRVAKAKGRDVTSDDISRISKNIDEFAKQGASINEQINSTFKDVSRTLMASLKPNTGAMIAAATSASPMFAALRSIYEKQQAYREKIDADASKDRNEQIELLRKELETLKQVSEPEIENDTSQELQRESNDYSDKILDVNNRQLDVLYELLRVWDVDNPILKELQEQRQLMLEAELQRQAEADLLSLQQTENNPEFESTSSSSMPKEIEEKKGMLDNLMSSVIGGMSGALASMLAFGAVIPMLKKALNFLKVGPLALAAVVIEFGMGFFDAKEILGKTDVTIAERLQAGAMQLLGSVGDLFDLGADLLGFETNVGETIRTITRNILQYPVDILNHITGYLGQAFDGIGLGTDLVDIPGIIYENVKGMIRDAVNTVANMNLVEKAEERMSTVKQAALDALYEKIVTVGDVLNNFFIGMFDDMLGKIMDLVDWLPDWTPGKETMLRQVGEYRSSLRETDPDTGIDPIELDTATPEELERFDAQMEAAQKRMMQNLIDRDKENTEKMSVFDSTPNPTNSPIIQQNSSNSSNVQHNYNNDKIYTVDYSDSDFGGPQRALVLP